MRADKLAAAGTEIKIEFTTYLYEDGNNNKEYKTDLTLTVVEKTETNIVPTVFTPAMVARDW